MKAVKSKLDSLDQSINTIIQANDLKEVNEPVLVDLINKIKQLGLELQDLVTALAKLEAALKELLSKLGGLDSERSLLEAEDKLNNLDGILEGLNEDLNKLTKLTKKIEPEATEEEESFIDQSNKDITNL